MLYFFSYKVLFLLINENQIFLKGILFGMLRFNFRNLCYIIAQIQWKLFCCYVNIQMTWTLFSDGQYAYFETSTGGNGYKAQLISPTFSTTRNQPNCLTFWYHMYGTSVNNLNVYLKSGNNLGRPVFTKHGNQGNRWSLAKINIRNKNNVKVRVAHEFCCLNIARFHIFFRFQV